MSDTMFEGWPKMARLCREMVVTEKIDGTNAQVLVVPSSVVDGRDDRVLGLSPDFSLAVLAGSRTRLLTIKDDNFGFAAWVRDNSEELVKLGPGRHFGEWWGRGVQRQYGKKDRTFSLFNTTRWKDDSVRPACCSVVPELCRGQFDTVVIDAQVEALRRQGSVAAPGFADPEGVVVFHVAAGIGFKRTIKDDHKHKGEQ